MMQSREDASAGCLAVTKHQICNDIHKLTLVSAAMAYIALVSMLTGPDCSSPDFQVRLGGVGVWVFSVVEGEGAQHHHDEQHARGPDIH